MMFIEKSQLMREHGTIVLKKNKKIEFDKEWIL